MKKRYKILIGILLFILISFAGGYYWLINGWKKFVSEEELSIYATEIKKHPPLSNEFKELYFKLYPKKKEATITGELSERVFNLIFKGYSGGAKQDCSCDDIIYYDRIFTNRVRKNNSKYDPLMSIKLGFGLERYLTNEECLNYSLRLEYHQTKNTKMGYSFEGKDFDDFNREDIIDYIIAVKAPTYFSPRLNPDRYKQRKKVIEDQINKNDL